MKITDEKEAELIDKYLTNKDNSALEKVISKHAFFIRKMAYKYENKQAEYDDLYQEGILEIIEAMPHFNEDKGLFKNILYRRIARRLGTYAMVQAYPVNVRAAAHKYYPLLMAVLSMTKFEDDEFNCLYEDNEEVYGKIKQFMGCLSYRFDSCEAINNTSSDTNMTENIDLERALEGLNEYDEYLMKLVSLRVLSIADLKKSISDKRVSDSLKYIVAQLGKI